MATVRIGERDLDVKPATLGFLKKQLIPAQRALAEAATEEDSVDRIAALILLYVGHNEGVDADFILDRVPANPFDVIRACAAAAGQRVPEGEAARQ